MSDPSMSTPQAADEAIAKSIIACFQGGVVVVERGRAGSFAYARNPQDEVELVRKS